MSEEVETAAVVEITDRDIVFDCEHCEKQLVIDRDGSGRAFDCPHCGGNVTVPDYDVYIRQKQEEEEKIRPVYNYQDMSEEDLLEKEQLLIRQLKENQSQRTEIQGHINKETIQLHRRKLQLQKLLDKQQDLASQEKAVNEAKKILKKE